MLWKIALLLLHFRKLDTTTLMCTGQNGWLPKLALFVPSLKFHLATLDSLDRVALQYFGFDLLVDTLSFEENIVLLLQSKSSSLTFLSLLVTALLMKLIHCGSVSFLTLMMLVLTDRRFVSAMSIGALATLTTFLPTSNRSLLV